MFKNQDTSVTKAKKAISDYKKAIGQSEGLAELMVFYCERAAGFSNESVGKTKATSMRWCVCSSRP